MDMIPLVGSVATGYGDSIPEPVKYTDNDQGLKDASRDFIGVLFSYMFQTMRGSPDMQEEGSLFKGENLDMFMSYLDQEVAQKFADQGGADLVNTLYHQLKGDSLIIDKSSTVPTLENVPAEAFKIKTS